MPKRPRIVCLCGSTRFVKQFAQANLKETLGGRIVLSIGCNTKGDVALFRDMPQRARAAAKRRLDQLHLRKIEMADEVLILNKHGYVGESTARELLHALRAGKAVRFLETEIRPLPRAARLILRGTQR